MRIISQDGTMDYPYEQCGVSLYDDERPFHVLCKR